MEIPDVYISIFEQLKSGLPNPIDFFIIFIAIHDDSDSPCIAWKKESWRIPIPRNDRYIFLQTFKCTFSKISRDKLLESIKSLLLYFFRSRLHPNFFFATIFSARFYRLLCCVFRQTFILIC